jgi:signal transduction histidine kinase
MIRDDQRLFTVFTLAVMALLLGSGLLLRWQMSSAMREDAQVHLAFLDLSLRDRSRFLASTLAQKGGRERWPEDLSGDLTRRHADYNRDIFMQVFEADGRPVAESGNTPAGVMLSRRTLLEGPGVIKWQSEDAADAEGRPVRLVTYPIYGGDPNDPAAKALGYAQAGLRLPDTARAIQSMSWLIAAIFSLTGLLCVMAARWIVRAASQRVKQDAATLQAAQHRFIGDAAHELGTPLAVLRGEIDIALRRERSAGEYHDALTSCREEIERLSRLSENLLSLATADSGAKLLHRESCDAVTVAQAVHRKFSRAAAEKSITFTLEAPDSLPWEADTLAIEQILSNLVSNALRHTPEHETVKLNVSQNGSTIVFTVTDTGEGIPAAHLPLIFDRFHRVDKARSRHIGGAGLGLSIVKTLVQAHGGTITVESTLGNGTSFRCEFATA